VSCSADILPACRTARPPIKAPTRQRIGNTLSGGNAERRSSRAARRELAGGRAPALRSLAMEPPCSRSRVLARGRGRTQAGKISAEHDTSNAMQFTRENANEANAILSCTEREVRLPGRSIAGSVIVTRDAVIEDWRPPELASLAIADFAALLALRLDVVLLGTGERQRLPSPALYADFAALGIGLEVMDNRAACRTYNVLLGEFRDVALALMLSEGSDPFAEL